MVVEPLYIKSWYSFSPDRIKNRTSVRLFLLNSTFNSSRKANIFLLRVNVRVLVMITFYPPVLYISYK